MRLYLTASRKVAENYITKRKESVLHQPIDIMVLDRRFFSLLLTIVSVSAYTWPDPQLDELESLLYDQHGFNERGILAGALDPCTLFNFGDTVNRSNAADWIRAVCVHFMQIQ